MAAPTAAQTYGGPSANYGVQFDQYGRPIATDARSGDAQFETFSIGPNGEWINGQSVQGWTPGQAVGGGQNASNARASSPTTGGYTPAAAQGSQVGQDAAYQALNLLSPIAQQGFTSADMMGIRAAQNSAALQSQAAIQALAQQAAMRGTGRGGIGQVQQAQAAQQASNFGAQQGANIAMAANDRRMNAISGLANIGFGADTMATGHQQAIDEQNRYAQGAQSDAAWKAYQGRYQDQNNPNSTANRITGMVGGLTNTITSMYGGGR